MTDCKFLVVEATGHDGYKVAIGLAERGFDVTALVRKKGATIKDTYKGIIKYAVGDLT